MANSPLHLPGMPSWADSAPPGSRERWMRSRIPNTVHGAHKSVQYPRIPQAAGLHARGVPEGSGGHLQARRARAMAAMVASISASVWAVEMKPVS